MLLQVDNEHLAGLLGGGPYPFARQIDVCPGEAGGVTQPLPCAEPEQDHAFPPGVSHLPAHGIPEFFSGVSPTRPAYLAIAAASRLVSFRVSAGFMFAGI